MSSAKWRPFCLSLNVLNPNYILKGPVYPFASATAVCVFVDAVPTATINALAPGKFK